MSLPTDGLLVIDKPAGPTSHDIVARVRRATGWTKVGHTGTLDPLATGVLPLVVGRATRLAQFVAASDKEYEAVIQLGWATDTYDAAGIPVSAPGAGPGAPRSERGLAAPSSDTLATALDRFRGSYLQAPPPFSAKKQDGVRAYELARRGQAVSPRAVPVTVYDISVLGIDADRLHLRIRCSAGFYVRSFAHDLGVALGTGAHVHGLRRTRSGDFDLTSAVALDQVEEAGSNAVALLLPPARLLASFPEVVVNEAGAERARHGNDLRPADCIRRPDGLPDRVKVVDEGGHLLAVARPSGVAGLLHPDVVVG